MTDTLDALERLARLHQSGALTDAEFADQKAKVLRGGGSVEGAGYVADAAPAELGWSGGRLLLAGLGAVLIGVLLWWQLVDSNGEVKQVPSPGSIPASRTVAKESATDAAKQKEGAISTDVADAPLVIETGAAPLDVTYNPSNVTYNPSFDCAGLDEPTLVMICKSPLLSRKDRELSELFKTILRSLNPADRETVLRQQRVFLRERSNCPDTSCVGEWYERTLAYYRDG